MCVRVGLGWSSGLVAGALLLVSTVHAAERTVGPSGRDFTSLTAANASNAVMPGDVVLVDGDATYGATAWTRSGTPQAPITLRGVARNGARPTLSGGTNTLEIRANHVVVEGFELTGGSFRCFYHHGNDVTLRDSVVHDCAAHGILGADQDSGSFTMDHVEVYATGNGSSQHQVYMATDEVAFPGSVFRMRYCYLHDANGGNSVKSRAERNEIHYNWIEGGEFHELELIGPDPNGAQASWTIDTAREDSEVVGNVLRKVGSSFVMRLGGDDTGWSKGRYRVVNNTIVLSANSATVFRLFDELESVEMHNNVIVRASGNTAINVLRANAAEMSWTMGRRISGSNNWVQDGATNTPAEWTGTLTGTTPGFTDLAALDFRPAPGSPLLDTAGPATDPPVGSPFPPPLLSLPLQHPPLRALSSRRAVDARPVNGALDIGAFERPGIGGTSSSVDAASSAHQGSSAPSAASSSAGEGSSAAVSPSSSAAASSSAAIASSFVTASSAAPVQSSSTPVASTSAGSSLPASASSGAPSLSAGSSSSGSSSSGSGASAEGPGDDTSHGCACESNRTTSPVLNVALLLVFAFARRRQKRKPDR